MKTVSLTEATEQFADLARIALQGESVFIEEGAQVLLLRAIPSMPVAPPGFYDDIYDEEYVKEAQLTEPHSVVSLDP